MAEKRFGSRTLRCEKLPPSAALSLLFRVGKALAPGVDVLAAFQSGDDTLRDALAMEGIARLFRETDDKAAVDLLTELCSIPTIDGDHVVPDVQLDLEQFVEVAVWTLDVQFRSFFKGKLLSGLLSKAQAFPSPTPAA